METRKVLRGLSTISFYATDHEAAKKWYVDFLGIEPYFSVPGYVEFRIGDYQHELGIIDSKFAPKGATDKPTGAIAYWHVDDLQATFDKLISLGASIYEPIIDRSQGQGRFVTASVIDPFGNILGIMTNKHYLEVLEKTIK
jgi:predicted enzyme related to lactoylglutathione lyase